MKTFKLATCGLLIALLAACGGSNSDNKSTENATDNTDNSPSPVYLTLDAMRSNIRCGGKQPDTSALFLVHDADGKILSEHQTDSNGHLKIEWTYETKHLTKISYNDPTDMNAGIQVNTFLNQISGDAGSLMYTSRLDIECECTEVDIFFDEINQAAPDSELIINNYVTDDPGGALTTGACPSVEMVDVQLISYQTQSAKAGRINLSSTDKYNLTLDDFTAEGVIINATAPTATSILTAYTDYYLFRNDSKHVLNNNQADVNPIFIYPEIHDTNIVMARDVSYDSLSNHQIKIYSNTRQKVDVQGNAPELTLWQFNDDLKLITQNILDQMQQESNTINFDFSQFDQNVSASYIEIAEPYDNDNRNSWMIYAGREGTIPDLDLPESIKSVFSNIQNAYLNISLHKHGDYFSWPEWRQLKAKQSRSEDHHLQLQYTNSHYIDLTVESIQ